jgi:hypothetical protein
MTESTGITALISMAELDSAVAELQAGSNRLQTLALREKRELIDACADRVMANAKPWVAAACQAKQIADDQAVAAEEILSGPTTLMRYLRLLSGILRDVEKFGQPQLPGPVRKNTLGQSCVPVFPVRSLFDPLTFQGISAEIWQQPNTDPEHRFEPFSPQQDSDTGKVAGVLGAGNVSVIPATDMLHKIFHDQESVLLKFNPVNEYLEPFLTNIFQPLIDANLLRFMLGHWEAGEAIVHHPGIHSIHITGSHITHNMIVWGDANDKHKLRREQNKPLLTKPITSELGNVSPWIVVPGRYTTKQLRAQAEHVAASITNNASYNCLATKIIITSKNWPQRDDFLGMIEGFLRQVPERVAYYPGAQHRFERATGNAAPQNENGTLPWTLIRDTCPEKQPHLFEEESFVCVCAETALDCDTDLEFLKSAVKFANERLFGTLCAVLTVTNDFQKKHKPALEQAISQLQYNSVCINQWSALAYALMTPPWGGYHTSTIEDPQSGIGHVHNIFNIANVEKSVLRGPLIDFPKPAWFPSHRSAHKIAWALLRLYEKPTISRLPALFFHALRK